MLRAHAAVTKQLDAEMLSAHGISLSSYEVLLHLDGAEDGHLRMSELAELAVLSRSGLTRLVDRLAREELLIRESCPSDARGSFARLTVTGRERLAQARPTHLEGVRRVFLGHLSSAEQQALAVCWSKLLPASEVEADCPASQSAA
ncbi:MAG: MarR family transcriptional regulator [Solirubrobacteraceae bacterium]|nr:MarR family transcriptional regulator [Solirubrobacteraceae bacterium]